MTLLDVLANSAGRGPSRPAFVFRDRRTSYGELQAQARHLAGLLAAAGVRPGDRVAMMLPNVPEFGAAYFGILAAGAAVVPLNPLLKPDEVQYILQDSAAGSILCLEMSRPLLAASRAPIHPLPRLIVLDAPNLGGEVSRAPAAGPPVPATPPAPGDVAACLYTSGTTGRPKGAMLTHGNLIANLASFHRVLHATEEEVFLAVLPFFHAYGATTLMLLPLSIGATTVLEPRFVPETILRSIVQHGVTIFMGVPSMFAVLAGLPAPEGWPGQLRFCISGGAPLSPAVLEAFEARHGTRIYEGYGPTECSPVLTVNPPDGLRKVGSVGPPIPDVEIRIVDEQGTSLPAGEVGEIAARGPNVMLGYLNRPDDTAAVIRDGWYHTGDLGRMDDDGYVYIVDRKTDLILVGGLNVYPSEVERVLSTHPGVAEAAVVGVPDTLRGEAVSALVIPRDGQVVATAELLQWCRQRLAAYKVPRSIRLVTELPRTVTGKVLKSALRRMTNDQ
jgi:long-chain acyl-CoA synthetase